MSRIVDFSRKAKQIYHTNGVVYLARQVFAFVIRIFFEYQAYYLSGHTAEDVRKSNEAARIPKVDSFTFKIVSTNKEADALEADGLEFRSYSRDFDTRGALDKGATAFCIFIDGELASIGWTATTQHAKDSLDQPPFKVDFSNNEACTGRA